MLSKHTILDDVYLTDMFVNLFIPISSAAGILFAIWLWIRVSAVKVRPTDSTQRTENGREYLLEEESRGEAEVRTHVCRAMRCAPISSYRSVASGLLARIPRIHGRQSIPHRLSPCGYSRCMRCSRTRAASARPAVQVWVPRMALTGVGDRAGHAEGSGHPGRHLGGGECLL